MAFLLDVLDAFLAATGVSRQKSKLEASFLLPAVLVCLEWYESRKSTEYVHDLHTGAQELVQMIMLYARNNNRISPNSSSSLSSIGGWK